MGGAHSLPGRYRIEEVEIADPDESLLEPLLANEVRPGPSKPESADPHRLESFALAAHIAAYLLQGAPIA